MNQIKKDCVRCGAKINSNETRCPFCGEPFSQAEKNKADSEIQRTGQYLDVKKELPSVANVFRGLLLASVYLNFIVIFSAFVFFIIALSKGQNILVPLVLFFVGLIDIVFSVAMIALLDRVSALEQNVVNLRRSVAKIEQEKQK